MSNTTPPFERVGYSALSVFLEYVYDLSFLLPSLDVAVTVSVTSSPVAVYFPIFTVADVPVSVPEAPSDVVYFATEAPSVVIFTSISFV